MGVGGWGGGGVEAGRGESSKGCVVGEGAEVEGGGGGGFSRLDGHRKASEFKSCVKSRWPSWGLSLPNEPYGFRGRKATLNHAV